MKKGLISIAVLFCSSFAMAQDAPRLNAQNIDQVMKAMTIDEKITLVIGYTEGNGYSGLPTKAPEGAKELVPGAAGQTTYMPRVGIPHTVLADGPAGLRISPTRKGTDKTYFCTAFPTSTLLASSWDANVIYKVGEAMGNEVLEYGADVLLAPGINIMRNPLCGRNFEYYSEDPLVAGKLSAAMINGIQSQHVGVSLKHFAANNQEGNRTGNDAVISQRALREIYLKPFEIAVKESQPWTVMSSYNKINGTFTQESKDLLTTLLRDEWGFKGIVMTDWTDARNTAAQIKAGNDLMMPGYQPQINDLKNAVKNGSLTEEDLDKCVRRILQYIVKTPRFQNYKFSDNPDLAAHAQVARWAAAEGMVLLKNNKATLPLKPRSRVALFGLTSYNIVAGGTGSGDVNEAYTIGLDEGLKNAGFKLDGALANTYKSYQDYQDGVNRSTAGFHSTASTLGGSNRIPEVVFPMDVYLATAQKDDVAIITLGRNAGEGADRQVENDFTLTTQEKAMIEHVCTAFHQERKPVVVIINAGGVIETASWKAQPDAILVAWQPGQEGGNSIADILKGDVNPSGKLTVTFPQKYDDHLSALNFPQHFTFNDEFSIPQEQRQSIPNIGTTYYEEGVYVGYRYFSTSGTEVSYPFGFGLSYTDFAYSQPKVSKKGNEYLVNVTVKNTGIRSGREVVQLYVSAPDAEIERPERELKAFAKTRELKPGESQFIELRFNLSDLAFYNQQNQQWQVTPGQYKLMIGASSMDIRAQLETAVPAWRHQCNNVLSTNKPLHEISLRPQIFEEKDVDEAESMVGNWYMEINVMGHDIKGAVKVEKDNEGWWTVMQGIRQPLEQQEDGSLKGSSDQAGIVTTFYMIPISENKVKMLMNIIGQEFSCDMERME